MHKDIHFWLQWYLNLFHKLYWNIQYEFHVLREIFFVFQFFSHFHLRDLSSCSFTSKCHLHLSILTQKTSGFCSVAPSCHARASCISQGMGSLLFAGSKTTWLQIWKNVFWIELLAKKTQYWQPFPGYPIYTWLPKHLKAGTSWDSAFTHHCAGGERIERENQSQDTSGGIVGLVQALLKLFEYSVWENINAKKGVILWKAMVLLQFTSPALSP